MQRIFQSDIAIPSSSTTKSCEGEEANCGQRIEQEKTQFVHSGEDSLDSGHSTNRQPETKVLFKRIPLEEDEKDEKEQQTPTEKPIKRISRDKSRRMRKRYDEDSLEEQSGIGSKQVDEDKHNKREEDGMVMKDVVSISPSSLSSSSSSSSSSCEGTMLEQLVSSSSFMHLSDFDCSESNEGWLEHIPLPTSNSSRAQRMWNQRQDLLKKFADAQDHYEMKDENVKYIVFYPIFAGIGNNLAVFAEALMIALRSNRKFLVYDWNTLRDYFYLPVQFEVITEKGMS